MRALTILAALCSLTAAAHADGGVRYLDVDRAINECRAGKEATTTLQADAAARERAKADAAKRPVVPTDEQWSAAREQKRQGLVQGISERLVKVSEAIRKEKRLAAVLPRPVVVDPVLDVTAEVIRRLDAGEGQGDASALKARDEEIARLKAQLAEQSKGAKSVPSKPR